MARIGRLVEGGVGGNSARLDNFRSHGPFARADQ